MRTVPRLAAGPGLAFALILGCGPSVGEGNPLEDPTASAKVANRLLEASRRQYWTPDAATLEALQRAGEELEDRLEGVFEEKVAALLKPYNSRSRV